MLCFDNPNCPFTFLWCQNGPKLTITADFISNDLKYHRLHACYMLQMRHSFRFGHHLKIVRKEMFLFNNALNTFNLRLAARVILYASSHRQDNTYYGICYTSCGALAGTRNSSMCPPRRIVPTSRRTMSERHYHGATFRTQNCQDLWFTDEVHLVKEN